MIHQRRGAQEQVLANIGVLLAMLGFVAAVGYGLYYHFGNYFLWGIALLVVLLVSFGFVSSLLDSRRRPTGRQ